MLELDGSQGEGGGQILRTSLALSLITGQPFHLRNVRARRSKPGLQPQHLMSVRAAATVGQAKTNGASKGSSDLSFEPGEVKPGRYHFSIGTAGATGLVLHTLYLPLALRATEPSEIAIQGGTHVAHSPCFHFLDSTWRCYLEWMGLRIKLKMVRPGFYPRGGGLIEANVTPVQKLKRILLTDRNEIKDARGLSAVAGLPESIAHRQARRAANRLQPHKLRLDMNEAQWSGGPGTFLSIELHTSPVRTLFFGLGARGKPAERVADEAIDQVQDYLEADTAAVDPHSADQIILPLVFAEGRSEFTVSEVTQHLLTNIDVIGQFVDREIECEGEEGKPGTVRIQ